MDKLKEHLAKIKHLDNVKISKIDKTLFIHYHIVLEYSGDKSEYEHLYDASLKEKQHITIDEIKQRLRQYVNYERIEEKIVDILKFFKIEDYKLVCHLVDVDDCALIVLGDIQDKILKLTDQMYSLTDYESNDDVKSIVSLASMSNYIFDSYTENEFKEFQYMLTTLYASDVKVHVALVEYLLADRMKEFVTTLYATTPKVVSGLYLGEIDINEFSMHEFCAAYKDELDQYFTERVDESISLYVMTHLAETFDVRHWIVNNQLVVVL